MLDPSKTIIKIETADNNTAFQILTNSIWCNSLKMNENKIQLEMDKKEIPSLVRYLNERNTEIYLIQPLNSLEDYFLNLTKSENHVKPFTN